jgi:hypothetical protein
MIRHVLSPGLGDAGAEATLAAIGALPAFAGPPATLEIDGDDRPVDDRWSAAMLAAERAAIATWVPEVSKARTIKVEPARSWVYFDVPEAFATVDDAVAILEVLPFDVCSFGSVWLDDWLDLDFERISFGDGHRAHGWGCALRGAGHDRLVSRRWLEHGPWRLVRRPGDLSVVQFHDLDADAETAYAQAHPGHLRMGISDEGGYLPRDYAYSGEIRGLYDGARRTLEVVVAPGGDVAPAGLRDAAAIKAEHRRRPPREKPVAQVAFVFLTETDARRHLHALWLHDLECWVADDRPKRRLDDAYQPPPSAPAWAR